MDRIWDEDADHRQSHRNKLGMAELKNHGFYITGRDDETGEPLEFPSPNIFAPRDLASVLPDPPDAYFTIENFEELWDRDLDRRQINERTKFQYGRSHLSAFWHIENDPDLWQLWQSRQRKGSS